MLKTSDGGTTWNVDTSLIDQHYLFSSGFNRNGKILFGTADGYILGDKDITGIDDKNEVSVPAFHLNQNYPNPFNPVTTIEYIINKNIPVNLVVYDILGNKVAELVNEIQRAGSYKINFNAAGLSSGVYFCRLNAGGITETRKLILIK